MIDLQIAKNQVRSFLGLWPLDEWWPGLNPEHRPLHASDPRGVYAFIRVCCPALGRSGDAIVAGLVRDVGWELVSIDEGVEVQRKKSTSGSQFDEIRSHLDHTEVY